MAQDSVRSTGVGSVRAARSPALALMAVTLALGFLAAACGHAATPGAVVAGDIPDSQVFVPYSPAAGGFTVNVPEGWARTESGAVVTFTDKFNSVRLESTAAATAPTVQSATHDELPAIRAASANFQPGGVTPVRPSGAPALLLTYTVDGPPDPVTAKAARLDVARYDFWKDGREVMLTLSGAIGSDNVDPWRTIADSFRWT